jgi:hypothetical protein
MRNGRVMPASIPQGRADVKVAVAPGNV